MPRRQRGLLRFAEPAACRIHKSDDPDFRWSAVQSAYQTTSPKNWWSNPGHAILGPGRPSGAVTPLLPRDLWSRQGTWGVGQRS